MIGVNFKNLKSSFCKRKKKKKRKRRNFECHYKKKKVMKGNSFVKIYVRHHYIRRMVEKKNEGKMDKGEKAEQNSGIRTNKTGNEARKSGEAGNGRERSGEEETMMMMMMMKKKKVGKGCEN